MSIKSGWFWVSCFLIFGIWGDAFAAPRGTLLSNPEQNIPEVVARVNGVDISSKPIKLEINRLLRGIKQTLSPAEKNKIVQSLVNKEIMRELVFQEAKAQERKADPALVDKELQALRKGYDSEEEYRQALQKRGITEEDLRKSMEVDIVAQKLLNDQVKGRVNINDETVKKYYDDHREEYHRPDAFRVRHIFISHFPPELLKIAPYEELKARKDEFDRTAAEKKSREILEKIRSGGDFAELARKYSEDSASAQNGGDLGFVYKGIFEPPFDEAVSKLQPGEVSDVVQTTLGYNIIKLLETRPAEYAPFSEMKETIQKRLFMREAQKIVGNYLDQLRKKAEIEIFY